MIAPPDDRAICSAWSTRAVIVWSCGTAFPPVPAATRPEGDGKMIARVGRRAEDGG